MGVKSVTAAMKALLVKRKFGLNGQNLTPEDLDMPDLREFTQIGTSGVSFMFKEKTAEEGLGGSGQDLSYGEEQDLADIEFSDVMFSTTRNRSDVHLAEKDFPSAAEGDIDPEIAALVAESATYDEDVDLVELTDFDIETLGDPGLFDGVKNVIGNFSIKRAVYEEATDKITMICEIETKKHPITGTIVDSVRGFALETDDSKYAIIELYEGHEPFISRNQCTWSEAQKQLGIITGLKKSASAYGPLTI